MLREDTARVWDVLKNHPSLSGFVLVGGTALTLHIGHRLSEDLDFSFGALRLPRQRINGLIRTCEEELIIFKSNDSPIDVEEFFNSGLDLFDYQQNYLINDTVKATFFCPDNDVRLHIAPGSEAGPRIATLDEIFAMKCLVSADRSKTRDWFDLYTLMNSHGFTPENFENVFTKSGVPQKMEIALDKLSSGRPGLEDEGYDSLLANPPTIKEMSDYFDNVRDDIYAAAARRRISKP